MYQHLKQPDILRTLILTDRQLCSWIGEALPGDRVIYHCGNLASDQLEAVEPDRRRLRALASAARRAFEAGLVHLVQMRLDSGFAYVVVARPKPRVAAVPVEDQTEEAG